MQDAGFAPGEIAFFDDSAENVNGANAAGMHGHHVSGFDDLRMLLTRMGIVDHMRHPYPGIGE